MLFCTYAFEHKILLLKYLKRKVYISVASYFISDIQGGGLHRQHGECHYPDNYFTVCLRFSSNHQSDKQFNTLVLD